jgi:xanthine dehydrogenase YagR molybdenum-binding subunit
VVAECGTQDVGTGTRTALGIVVASSLGLPVSGVQVRIGDTLYPASGASKGSSTIGGVAAAGRRAAKLALVKLKEAVAPALGVSGDVNAQIESRFARLAVKVDFNRQISWRQACNKLGARSIVAVGREPQANGGKLADSGVGGVQMADVSVDTETGVVTVNKMVAVQDCGLVINLKAAESQVYGALAMGISQALWEERVYDEASGKLLNADMEFYGLTGIGDIGELVVHVMTGVYDERGVIGLADPPAISPGPAISNAVFNAIGVRVPTLPLTPDKVLAALSSKGPGKQ